MNLQTLKGLNCSFKMVTFGLLVVLSVLASSQAYHARFFDNALNVGRYEDPARSMARNLNCGNIQHPLGCTFSSDCSVKTCTVDFVGLTFQFKITINKCENPVSVTVSFHVKQLNLNFGHTFPASEQTIPVPGLENGFGPLRGGVFIKVSLRPENGKLNALVQLQCGIAFGNQPIFPIVLDLIKGPLPIKTDQCGGGGGLPPPPGPGPLPPAPCDDSSGLCGILASQCSNPAVSSQCPKTCNAC